MCLLSVYSHPRTSRKSPPRSDKTHTSPAKPAHRSPHKRSPAVLVVAGRSEGELCILEILFGLDPTQIDTEDPPWKKPTVDSLENLVTLEWRKKQRYTVYPKNNRLPHEHAHPPGHGILSCPWEPLTRLQISTCSGFQ